MGLMTSVCYAPIYDIILLNEMFKCNYLKQFQEKLNQIVSIIFLNKYFTAYHHHHHHEMMLAIILTVFFKLLLL